MSMHKGRNRSRGALNRSARAVRARNPAPALPERYPIVPDPTQAVGIMEAKQKKPRKGPRGKAKDAHGVLMLSAMNPALPQMPSSITANGTPCFPSGLVAPKRLGVIITSVAMPDVKRRPSPTPPQASSAETIAPQDRQTASDIAPKLRFAPLSVPTVAAKPPNAPVVPSRPALTLPKQPEPLVVAQGETQPVPRTTAHTDDRTPFFMPEIALPRHRSLAQPSQGLVGAIGAWLHSFSRLIASGFLVKKTRKPSKVAMIPANRRKSARHVAAQPSLREAAEVTQLRAENRRLRSQLDALDALRHGTPTPQSTAPANAETAPAA